MHDPVIERDASNSHSPTYRINPPSVGDSLVQPHSCAKETRGQKATTLCEDLPSTRPAVERMAPDEGHMAAGIPLQVTPLRPPLPIPAEKIPLR